MGGWGKDNGLGGGISGHQDLQDDRGIAAYGNDGAGGGGRMASPPGPLST